MTFVLLKISACFMIMLKLMDFIKTLATPVLFKYFLIRVLIYAKNVISKS